MGRALTSALLVFAGHILGAQSRGALPWDPAQTARPSIHVYDERDGVASSPFEAIALDAQGVLWCGTQDGIQRYNGHEWTRVPLPEGNRSAWVCSIQPASDGSMWFGTNGNGLHHLKDGVWTSYTERTGFPGLWASALAETRDGQGRPVLWVGTGKEGLWQLRGDRLEPVPGPRTSRAVTAILPARDGSLWVSSQDGLFHLKQGVWSRLKAGDWTLPTMRVNCLAEGEGGDLWAGTDQGLACLHQGRWRTYRTEQGLPALFVSVLSVYREQDGTTSIWAGTDRGLGIFREGRWSCLDNRRGLPSNIIRSLLVARNPGSPTLVWIGTFAGLARLVPGKWLSLNTVSGLQDNLVFSIREGQDHSFWFGTGGAGIVHLAKGAWSATDSVEGHAITTILTLARPMRPPGKEILYAGTRDAGVVVRAGDRWHMWEHNAELPQPSVFALLETRDAAGEPVLWVGTRGGLFRSGRDGTQVYEKGTGLHHDHVTALVETVDAAGKAAIWVGTQSNDVARFDPEHPERPWTFLSEAERAQLPSRNVQAVQAEPMGGSSCSPWAGSRA